MKFTAIIFQSGKTSTGIEVPSEIVEQLKAGKKPPVSVTLKDYTYRTTIASMGGKFLISVSSEVREKAKVKAGDEVEVTLELDTAPREVEIPEDFQQALNKNSKAKTAFEKLSYSNKRRYTWSIADAKTEETRQRRIEKAISELGK